MAPPRRTAAEIARELAQRTPRPDSVATAPKVSPLSVRDAADGAGAGAGAGDEAEDDADVLILDEDRVAEELDESDVGAEGPRNRTERTAQQQRAMYKANIPRTAPTQPTSIRVSKSVMEKRNQITTNALRKILYVVGPIGLRAPAFAPVFGNQAYPYFKLFGFVNPEASIVLLRMARQMYPTEYANETMTGTQRDSVLRSFGMPTQITIEDILRNKKTCEDLAQYCSSSLDAQERKAKEIFGSMEGDDPNLGLAKFNPAQHKALALKSLQSARATDRKIPKSSGAFGFDFSEFFSWDIGALLVGLPEADCFVNGLALATFMKQRGFADDARAIATAHRENTPIVQFTQGSASLRELVASSLGALAEFALYAEQERSIKSNHVVSVNTQRNRLNMFNKDKNPLLAKPEYDLFKKALLPAAISYADLATPQGVFVLFNIADEDAYEKQRTLLNEALLHHGVEAPELRHLVAISRLGPYNLGIQRAWCNLVMSNIPLMHKLSQI